MDNSTAPVIGVDLAKDVFQMHWVDRGTGEVFNKKLSRKRFHEFFINREPCLVGMEACGGAHYWARALSALGHEVRLMPGKDAEAFNPGNKDDASDARAIWAATKAGTTRKVAVKTEEQQAVLAMHRIREQKIRQRVATANQIRGLLSEFGLVVARGQKALMDWIPSALESLSAKVPKMLVSTIEQLRQDIRRLNEQISGIEKELKLWSKGNEACCRLQEIDGVGLITATAVIANVGDASEFKSGRQMSAFFGLVPRHTGSGGKIKNLGMSKRGDGYIRRLVIHCARAVVTLMKEPPKVVERLKKKHHTNVVIGAMANRILRTMWSMLVHGTRYERNHISVLCGNCPQGGSSIVNALVGNSLGR